MDVYDGESFKFFEDYASGGSQVLHTWKADSSGKRTQEVEIDRKIYALFKNRGHNDVLEIFWVGRNEDGSENLVPQGEIPPLKWIGVGTHPGHTFAVKIKFGQKKGELLLRLGRYDDDCRSQQESTCAIFSHFRSLARRNPGTGFEDDSQLKFSGSRCRRRFP